MNIPFGGGVAVATSVEVVVSVTKTVVEHELSASSAAIAKQLNADNKKARRILGSLGRHWGT